MFRLSILFISIFTTPLTFQIAYGMDSTKSSITSAKCNLKIEDVYAWNIPEKSSAEITRIAAQGAMAYKLQKNYAVAIPLLEECALYEHVPSIILLSEFCETTNQFDQAAQWMEMAFEIHWMNTGQHHEGASIWLKSLPNSIKKWKEKIRKNTSLSRREKRNTSFVYCDFLEEKILGKDTRSAEQLISDMQNYGTSGSNISFFNSYPKNLDTPKKRYDSFISLMGLEKLYSVDVMDIEERLKREMKQMKHDKNNFDTYLSCLHRMIWLEKIYLNAETSPLVLNTRVADFQFKGLIQREAYLHHKIGTPESYFKLASLYENGKLGEPDHQKAFKYYNLSKTTEAYEKLGFIYENGNLIPPDYEQAIACYKLSGSIQSLLAWVNLSSMHEADLSKCTDLYHYLTNDSTIHKKIALLCLLSNEYICNTLEIQNSKDHFSSIKTEIEEELKNWTNKQESLIYSGYISLFEERYDDALIFFYNSNLYGVYSDNLIDYAQKLKDIYDNLHLSDEELLAAEAESDSQEEMSEIEILEESSKLAETPEVTPRDSTTNNPSSVQDSFGDEAVSTTSPEGIQNKADKHAPVRTKRPKQSAQEIREKYVGKMQRAKQRLGIVMQTVDSSQSKKQLPRIEYEYYDTKVQNTFYAMKATESKLNTLLEDIAHKPWATEGEGKPEVLKYKYKGLKGCLSRRINSEDRLVYKIKGNGKILIVSCKGHYKK